MTLGEGEPPCGAGAGMTASCWVRVYDDPRGAPETWVRPDGVAVCWSASGTWVGCVRSAMMSSLDAGECRIYPIIGPPLGESRGAACALVDRALPVGQYEAQIRIVRDCDARGCSLADYYAWRAAIDALGGLLAPPGPLLALAPPGPLVAGDIAVVTRRSHTGIPVGTLVVVTGLLRRRVYAVGWVDALGVPRAAPVQAACLRLAEPSDAG